MVKAAVVLLLLACVLAAGAGVTLWYVWSSNLPYIGTLREYHPPVITEAYCEDGEVIGRFWEEKRIVVPLDRMPKHLIQAFIAAEDASLLLKDTEKTYRRKAREATLSLQIERAFSKEQILYLYLNQIYLGQGAYGVEAAGRTYFDKTVSELNLAESALLAGLTQAPSRYSLFLHFNRAKARQKYVLERMREENFITAAQEKEALAWPVEVNRSAESASEKSPYFTEHVRRVMESKYGREALYREGLKIFTTLNLGMQRAAQAAVEKGLLELDKREASRGPSRSAKPVEAGTVQKAASPEGKEVSLSAGATVQGALFAMEARTGKVRAMVGGRDFGTSQFNRAIQAKRQPGSAFKPIIYAAALDWGMTPSTIIVDAPYLSSVNPDEEIWRPKNFREKFSGPTL
ncbi:MAG: transglycosylase domain-containing protein, partial [Desulfobacterota bacterium]|nr:transglycosylase domain-containing protein [Thermodesulfobacteriota bacterium]